jgi:hypothetical protein
MAKPARRKTVSRKASKKAPKKAPKRAGPKAPKKNARPARKAAAARGGPVPVTTGRGATPLEVARDFVELCRAGKLAEVEDKWLAPAIVSVEGLGASVAWSGKKAVLAKYRAWEADHEIHDFQVEGPWVGATGFAVRMAIDVEQKSTAQRSRFEEIAVYTVQNGKIVREEFMFPAGA